MNRPLPVYTKEWVVDMRIIRNGRDRGAHRPERRDALRKLWQWSALPLAGCAVVAVFIAVMQITLAAGASTGAQTETGYILIDPATAGPTAARRRRTAPWKRTSTWPWPCP